MIRLGASGATTTKRMAVGAGLGLAAVVLAACGSSSSGGNSVTSGGQPSSGSGSGSSSSPGTKFSVANVAGLGNVLVDARGRTVYALEKGSTKNPPCTDGNGCTTIWPDLSLPSGVSKATAGSGLSASMLKSKKESDGETYATYNGWLLYEYSGDSAAGQGHGEGLTDTWGTWHALSASGTLVMKSSGSGTSPSSGGGYGY